MGIFNIFWRQRFFQNVARRTYSSVGQNLKTEVADHKAPLSIYVHFPYCSQICSFCAFNKYKLPTTLDHADLYKSYVAELLYNLSHYLRNSDRRTIRSIYFGGGTPSLSPRLVQHVIDCVKSHGFQLDERCEVTLEANPSSLPDLTLLSDLGVTRVSLGVQSLVNDKQLRKFNREHSVMQSREALDRLVAGKETGLLQDGFSFDLMFGNPIDQSPDQHYHNVKTTFSRELQAAVPYAEIGGHLSLYELTLEHGTPLQKSVCSGQVVMPDQDSNAEEYEEAVTLMTAKGFDHYEISSFALPSRYSRHNFSFWMYEDLVSTMLRLPKHG